jgi:hypothetical protein
MPLHLILQGVVTLVEVFVELTKPLGQLLRARLAKVDKTGFEAILDGGDIHALGDGDYLDTVGRPPHALAGVGYLLPDPT